MSVSEKTEGDWLPYGISVDKPNTSNTGNLRVIGYVITDSFSLFLGNLDDHVADIDYNLSSDQFIVRPLTGSMKIKVIKDNLQQTLNINQETTFIFDGEEIPEEQDLSGIIKEYFIKQDGIYRPFKSRYLKSDSEWDSIK